MRTVRQLPRSSAFFGEQPSLFDCDGLQPWLRRGLAAPTGSDLQFRQGIGVACNLSTSIQKCQKCPESVHVNLTTFRLLVSRRRLTDLWGLVSCRLFFSRSARRLAALSLELLSEVLAASDGSGGVRCFPLQSSRRTSPRPCHRGCSDPCLPEW